jgi:acyl-CoA thioesterase YciA
MIRVSMMPRDTNSVGTIFGGVILGHLDLAGAMEAMRRYQKQRFVTIALREVVFRAPVFVGDLVSFYTRITRVGTTSVTVRIVVEAERLRTGERHIPVTEAEAIYVAVDDERRPVPLAPAS